MSQFRDFVTLSSCDRRTHIELVHKLLKQAQTKPSQRRFAMWLREKKIYDRSFVQFMSRLLDIKVGKQVVLGEFGEELAAELGPVADELSDTFRALLFDRFVELNGYLVQFVLCEIADGFLAPAEVVKRTTGSAYCGDAPAFQPLQEWLKWMEWLGYMQTVGFRQKLTEDGIGAWHSLKDVPAEELLGGAGALGVLAGLGEDDEGDEEAEDSVETYADASASSEASAASTEKEPSPKSGADAVDGAATSEPPAPYIVAADIPTDVPLPQALPPDFRPEKVAGPVDDLDEEEPDFGPEQAPLDDDPDELAGRVGEEAEHSGALSDDEREAIVELFGEEALADLEPAAGPAGLSDGELASELANLTEQMKDIEVPVGKVVAADVDQEGGGEATQAAVTPAAEPSVAVAPADDVSSESVEECESSAAEVDGGSKTEVAGRPTLPVTAEEQVGSPVATLDQVALLASGWESRAGQQAVSAAELAIERESAEGALWELAIAALVLGGESAWGIKLELIKTMLSSGLVGGLYAREIDLEGLLTELPRAGELPVGWQRACEPLVHVAWLRALLVDLARDLAAGRAANRLHGALVDTMGWGAWWVAREMRSLGFWT